MAKANKAVPKKGIAKAKKAKNYLVVTNKSYGNKL